MSIDRGDRGEPRPSPTQARQGARGLPILGVLVLSMAACAILFAIIWSTAP